MKRSLAALVATVAGLVLLLSFKSGSARSASSSQLAAANPTTAPPAAAGSAAPPTAAAPQQSRTVTGKSVSTRYGDVQVQITLSGTRITAVTPVKLPDSNGIDQAIDQQVVPMLVQESLTAQSANIDMISGATYTSDGYIRSLQSAIDKAKA